jgi:hypothetical protein
LEVKGSKSAALVSPLPRGAARMVVTRQDTLETDVTSTESSQHFTLSLEDHPVIQIILPFGSWNGGIYVSGEKVFDIAITIFAERRCKFKEVCSWYFSCSSQ